ncbi:GTP-binding protein RHO1 [Papilio machaon]|uniref:GTP-binding protein RHO1 n=1 Tax=Papilio machaon TaxID=76193 RepID=UPI001E665D12|nr:GTP-binding protein RHO1 [Papilio machaon]XP_014361470.2 GTP-binding protein RHO1 [Papilio machaon]XP_014361472.2 GTP-binding protein RHO1 [Papilio machaon]XP_045537104.1 GTP-binding protein RHO1 [Papilio machaon]
MWSGKKGSEGGDAGTPPAQEEVKLVLVGDSQCGKTALVQRLVSDTFLEAYTPTGFEKYAYTCTVADCRVSFSVWDTSGTTAYDTVRPLAYQDAKVFMLCFNIAEPDSLHNAAAKWYREVRTHGGCTPGAGGAAGAGSAPVLLCGCKADLRHDKETLTVLSKLRTRPVTSEEALAVARQLGATTYVETSSRASGKGVRDAFEVAALAALGKLNKQQKQVGRSKSKRDLKAELKGRARSCCVM